MFIKTAAALAALAFVAAKSPTKPNIVLILTDDQDTASFERRFLPQIYKHLVDEGVKYDNFFTPYAHSHNITFVQEPWGGWQVWNDYGYVGHSVPDFLQQAGYGTYYVGKYMNGHTVKNCESLPVSGFTSSDFLVDPYTYDYWNPAFTRDTKIFTGEYSTDLIRDKSLAYLDDAFASDKPFFLGIAPIAPHSWMKVGERGNDKLYMHVPSPHPRHATLYATEELPRSISFNPDEPMGVSWVKDLPKLNSTQIAYLDDFHRGRLRSLMAVDEMVEDVVKKLEEAGQLDNTYIFYTADNGFAMGTHRRQPGKTLGFDEDINVPLIVRGPGVKKGHVDSLSSYGMVDLASTMMEIAGAKPDYQDEGVRMNLHQDDRTDGARHALAEFWVYGIDEGVFGGTMIPNNTYRTLRIHDEVDGKPTTWSYSVWCTGERELYDLTTDPRQVRNILAPLNAAGRFAPFNAMSMLLSAFVEPALDAVQAYFPGLTSTLGSVLERNLLSPDHQRVLHRLDALILALKNCAGDSCKKPYEILFPGSEVTTFAQALESKYDSFFINLPKVQFTKCALGFEARREQPIWQADWAFARTA